MSRLVHFVWCLCVILILYGSKIECLEERRESSSVLNATNCYIQFNGSPNATFHFPNPKNNNQYEAVFSIYPSRIIEYQYPKALSRNFTTVTRTAELIKSQRTIINSISLDSTTFSVSSPEPSTFEFNSTLPNDSLLSMTFSLNTQEPYTIPIPRPPLFQNCSDPSNLYSPPSCTCATFHTIPKDNIKYSSLIQNFTFNEDSSSDSSTTDELITALSIELIFEGFFTFGGLTDINILDGILQFNVCDVGNLSLFILDGTVRIPVSLFSTGYLDGVASTSRLLFDWSQDIGILSDGRLLVVFEHSTLTTFEDSWFYDPDLSLLFKGGGREGGSDENEGGHNNKASNSVTASSASELSLAWIAALMVPCICLFIFCVVIAIVVVTVNSYRKRVGRGQITF